MDASPSLPVMFSAPSCEVTAWFDREVRPHESALRDYLRTRFPSLPDPDDVVQEAYIRVLRFHGSHTLRSPKSLLFIVARNLATDVFRRQHTAPEALPNFQDIAVVDADESVAVAHEQKLQMLEEALQSLPERCREVVLLKRFHNLSYEEISRRMGISHNTISAHMTAGMSKCRDYFRARGITGGES